MIALEPKQADLLERICAGPLQSAEELLGAGAFAIDDEKSAAQNARVKARRSSDRACCGDNSSGCLALAGVIAHHDADSATSLRDMSSSRQGDLFGHDQQDDLSEDRPTPIFRADPDEVRAELHRILAEARAAQTIPWNAANLRLYRTIFPQMTNWLPEDEGTQLRFEFEAELTRLKAA